ncbi:fibronectin type III domain-containing protein [candidate division KSB1 bacterium]
MIKFGRNLICFIAFLGLTTGAIYGQEVKIPGMEGSIGDLLSVPVKVSDVTGMGIIAFEMILHYDPGVLQATGASVGGAITGDAGWPEPVINTLIPGEVIIAAIGTNALKGAGDLVYVNFEVLGGGAATTSPLDIEDFVFNENIRPQRSSGLFQYRGAAGVLAKVTEFKVDPGDTVWVPVLVDNVSNRSIYAYQFELTYDDQMLTPLDVDVEATVTGESGWDVPTINPDMPGMISVAAAGTEPLSGGGHLIRFQFAVAANAAGATVIDLANFIFNEGVPVVEARSGGVEVRLAGAIPIFLPNIAGEPNTSVTIPVTVGLPLDGQNVLSYEFGIKFDPDILIPKGVTTVGTISEKWGKATANLNSAPGEIWIAHAGEEPLTGKGKLVTLFFEIPVTASGLTFLEFVDFYLNEPETSPDIATDNGSLSLAGDDVPPEIISGPTVVPLGATTFQINWVTDEPSNSIIVFGEDTTQVENLTTKIQDVSELVTDHSVILESLKPETEHYYRIASADAFSNLTPRQPYGSFITLGADIVDTTVPEIIGNYAWVEDIEQNSVSILWDTNKWSNSLVRYWTAATEADPALDSDQSIVPPKGSIPGSHEVSLTGLDLDTKYYFQVSSTDVSGNKSAWTPVDSFKTTLTIDTTPPVVSSVAAPGISDTKALITWITSEKADSYVEYGKTTEYGKQTPLSPATVIDHQVLLTGLDSGSTYYYRVASTDASGNGPTFSSNKMLMTLTVADRSQPAITSGPAVEGIGDKSVTVVWTTNELSTSAVKYGEENLVFPDSVSSSKYVTDHRVLISNLTPNTVYYYIVESTDISGNTKSLTFEVQFLGVEFSFKTEELGDVLPPLITGGPIAMPITNRTEKIFWLTDELSNSVVDYGLSTDYDQKKTVAKIGTTHEVRLTELIPDTTYHYRVSSADLTGNKVSTAGIDYTFTTLTADDTKPPVIIAGPVTKGVTDTTATIVWTTNELCNTFVEFGETESLGELWGFADESIHHKVTLIGLKALTTYYYAVNSTDASDNTVDSKDINPTGDYVFSFKTKAFTDTAPPVIVAGPLVTGRTDVMAQVRWLTDELSDSYILFGTSTDEATWGTQGNMEPEIDHQVVLTNLTLGTWYNYKVKSTDLSLNSKTSEVARKLKTKDEADTKPPIITKGPILKFKTDDTAGIFWETDELALSKVEYGPDMDYGMEVLDPFATYRYRHYITITDLAIGTNYYYRVTSTDPSDNSVSDPPARPLGRALQPPGGGGSFTTSTEPDTRSPLIIAGPTVVARTNSAVTFEWETDESADTKVDYGEATDYEAVYEDGLDVKTHRVTLTNLSASTTYNYRVASTDPSNNPAVTSANAVVTTDAEADVIAPTITDGPTVLYKTNNRATISWETDEPATSRIDFGTSTDYDDNKEDIDFVNEHMVTITNLTANTSYHIKATTRDVSGNETESSDMTFTTEATADLTSPTLVGSVSTGAVSNETAEIIWETNEISDSFIHYGEDQASLDLDAGLEDDVTDHIVFLSSLKATTVYYYKVGSTDPAGNTTEILATGSFTTLSSADTQAPAKPTGLVASAKPSSVILSWAANTEFDLAGYNIQRAAGAAGDFGDIATLVTAMTYTDPGLTFGSLYRYRINASDRNGNVSSYSDVISAIPSAIELAEFTATASEAGATVKWAVVEEEDLRGFRLLRSESEDGVYRAILPKNRQIPSGRRNYKYVDRTAEVGKTYYYKLEALSLNGDATSFGPLAVDMVSVLPRQYALSQNYPNPFNPETNIQYALPADGMVELTVYDIMGHQVRKLVEERKEAGYHQVRWDGRDDHGGDVPSGIYFYRIQAVDTENLENNFQAIKKMVIIK